MNEPKHARAEATEPQVQPAPEAALASGVNGASLDASDSGPVGPGTEPATNGSVGQIFGEPAAEPADADGASEQQAIDKHGAAVQAWRARTAKRRKQKRKRPWYIEVPILLVTAFVLTFLIQTFLVKVYYVPSGSMEQTLHGVESGGDRILVNKIVYDFKDPSPGDVVVFRGPPRWAPEANIPGPTSWLGKVGQALGSVVGIAPANEKDYVKRVIAVGGQEIKCCDTGGNIVVDGVSLDESGYVFQPIPFEPGVNDCTTADKSQRCFGPLRVPADSLWMMGDNRSHSADSTQGCQGGREATYCQGPIRVDDVIGKAIFIIMPVDRWDTIGDPGIDQRAGS